MFEVTTFEKIFCSANISPDCFLVQVMESAWLMLQNRFQKASCLDDIIAAHDAYLSDILDRGLLTSTHEALNMQVVIISGHNIFIY